MTPGDLNRRTLLQLGAGAAAVAAVGTARSAAAAGAQGPFQHGVASGDPTAGGIVLWTRVTPTAAAVPGSGKGKPTEVRWEVGADERFRTVVAAGRRTSFAASDHTVHVDVRGLRPATTYWYRFSALGSTSVVGRTRTAPSRSAATGRLRLGVVTCTELEWGWFGAYRSLARRDDLDAVLYLGDYLYEYPAGSYDAGRTPGPAVGRTHAPAHECTTLADYRLRHATYRLDADLQALHARHPAIAVWDDHETANDAWRDGAQNHSADEGPYRSRFTASRQAYLEWLPVRRPAPKVEPLRIHRSFRFGNLAELWMLDERSYRDQQADAAFLSFGSVDPAIGDPERSILGRAQRDWLLSGVARSGARWKLIGNPVPLTPHKTGPDSQPLLDLLAGFGAVTPVHHPIVATDTWDGYAAEQRALIDAFARSRDVVVLTGDAHASYAHEVPLDAATFALDRRSAAVEFVAPGVTSPGLTRVIESQGLVGATRLESLLAANNAAFNPWTRYYDGTVNGYGLLDLTPQRARYEFWHLDDPMVRKAEPTFAAAYEVAAGTTTLVEGAAPAGRG